MIAFPRDHGGKRYEQYGRQGENPHQGFLFRENLRDLQHAVDMEPPVEPSDRKAGPERRGATLAGRHSDYEDGHVIALT